MGTTDMKLNLIRLIKKHKAAYYTGKPTISDEEYDALEDQLREIDSENPVLMSIGSEVKASAARLPFPMGSQTKIKATGVSEISRFQDKYQGTYVVSDKLDGISCLVTYTDGKLDSVYTRGDGKYGQDITTKLRDKFPATIAKGAMAVEKTTAFRGELIIPKKRWDTSMGTNARSVVAGLVNAKSPKPNIMKLVKFVVYEIKYPLMRPSDGLNLAKACGFHMVHWELVKSLNAGILTDILIRRKKESAYDIDGIVVAHDELTRDYEIVNEKLMNPTTSFAFKDLSTMEGDEAIVEDVEWKVSKDGKLKPTVVFKDPVNLGGVQIRRATGHNAANIETNGIGRGAVVHVIRSGDVIPYITRVITPSVPCMPSEHDTKWDETHTDLVLSGEGGETRLPILSSFISKMKLDGLGPGIAKVLFESHGVSSPYDFLAIRDETQVPKGVAGKKILEHIERLKKNGVDYRRLAVATNLLGLGMAKKKLDNLLEKYPEIESGHIPNVSAIASVAGFSETSAPNVHEGLVAVRSFIHDMKSIGYTFGSVSVSANEVSKKFRVMSQIKNTRLKDAIENGACIGSVNGNGTTIHVAVSGFRDEELEKQLKRCGVVVQSAVNGKTDALVVKDLNKSTKLIKARELGIEIVVIG